MAEGQVGSRQHGLDTPEHGVEVVTTVAAVEPCHVGHVLVGEEVTGRNQREGAGLERERRRCGGVWRGR